MENNKPLFHITPTSGWINDPNGIVKFNGKYHVFYQFHPYSLEWGPMHWGHVVSEDLLHWEHLPNALTPGDPFDKDGCFSGTSFIKDGVLYVAYTGFINNEDPEKIRQIQCLASSTDGIHFKKHGMIIDETNLPSKYKPTDFRDPKLYFKNGYFHLLVAAKQKEGKGSILLYKSKDLKKREFVNDVLTHESEGNMIECVDYHKDLNLLLYSEQDFPAENEHCLNIHSCEYELGTINDEGKFVSTSKKQLLDYGFDFYAPQIMNDDHYLVAWMNMWDRNIPSRKFGFAGMLTVPRKVTIEDGILRQTPVIYGKLSEDKIFDKFYEGNLVSGVIHLTVKELKNLKIKLRKGEDEETLFYLKDGEFYFDRSKSGEQISGLEKDAFSIKNLRKLNYFSKICDEIYLVLDKYSVEIFVNGISSTNTIYPKESSDKFEIEVESTSAHIEVYK